MCITKGEQGGSNKRDKQERALGRGMRRALGGNGFKDRGFLSDAVHNRDS